MEIFGHYGSLQGGYFIIVVGPHFLHVGLYVYELRLGLYELGVKLVLAGYELDRHAPVRGG